MPKPSRPSAPPRAPLRRRFCRSSRAGAAVTGRPAPVSQECVEGYLYALSPVRILVFRRPPSRGRIWVPISGKVDATDASFPEALRRELREETGLRKARRLFALNWAFRFRGPDHRIWRLHAYGVEVRRGWKPRLSREHEAWAWLAPDVAIQRLFYPDNRQALRRLLARLRRESTRQGRRRFVQAPAFR